MGKDLVWATLLKRDLMVRSFSPPSGELFLDFFDLLVTVESLRYNIFLLKFGNQIVLEQDMVSEVKS